MDDDGQLIIISGFIMAMGLVVLAIMLNSVIYTGNTAYEGLMSTHDKEILYINDLTLRETQNAYDNSFPSGYYDSNVFDRYMDSYSEYLTKLYASKGISVSISDYTCTPGASNHGTSSTKISYSDGEFSTVYVLTGSVINN